LPRLPAPPLFPSTTLFRSAWLWLPRLRGRDAALAATSVAVAGLVAFGLTAKVASKDPWFDYRNWSLTVHKKKTIAFDWRHTYGRSEEHTSELQSRSDLVCR